MLKKLFEIFLPIPRCKYLYYGCNLELYLDCLLESLEDLDSVVFQKIVLLLW